LGRERRTTGSNREATPVALALPARGCHPGAVQIEWAVPGRAINADTAAIRDASVSHIAVPDLDTVVELPILVRLAGSPDDHRVPHALRIDMFDWTHVRLASRRHAIAPHESSPLGQVAIVVVPISIEFKVPGPGVYICELRLDASQDRTEISFQVSLTKYGFDSIVPARAIPPRDALRG